MIVLGVDLGVRSIHVSKPDECLSIVVGISERWEEITDLASAYGEILDEIESEYSDSTVVYLEEPVAAGVKNLRTFLSISQVSGAVLSQDVRTVLVPVTKWKKEVVGHGFARKDDVAFWLERNNPYDYVMPSQDHVDATCIRLYGEMMEA